MTTGSSRGCGARTCATAAAAAAAIAILATAGRAGAEMTEPEEVTLAYEGHILEAFAYDTGWLPDPSADVRIRFTIALDGDVASEMTGSHMMSWPEAFDFTMVGELGGGWIEIGYGLTMDLMLEYDLGILGSGSYDIPIHDLVGLRQMTAYKEFTPFLLPYSTERPQNLEGEGGSVSLLEVPFSITTGVTFTLNLAMHPQLECILTGERIDLGSSREMDREMEWVHIPWERDGTISIPITLDALLDCTLDIVLVPSAELCIGTCFDVAEMEIDIPIQDEAKTLTYETVIADYTYPVLRLNAVVVDFGDVEVGSEVHVDVPVGNTGSGFLAATGSVTASTPFEVFPPEGVVVPGGEERPLRITFRPPAEGDYEGTLTIDSDAPALSTAEVTVKGRGVVTPVPEPEDASEDEPIDFPSESSSCGCVLAGAGGAARSSSSALLAALVLGLSLAIAASRGRRG